MYFIGTFKILITYLVIKLKLQQ